MHHLPQERLHIACAHIATRRMRLELTLEYAKERRRSASRSARSSTAASSSPRLVTKVEVTQTYIDHCVWPEYAGELPGDEAAKAK